jgi:hypothetical protein
MVESAPERGRVLNAVALQNAVLCVECDVVSDSPHDQCLVCGSRSLFNIARLFGGNLRKKRASVIAQEPTEITSRDGVLTFPKPHRPRRRAAGSSQLSVVALDDSEAQLEHGMQVGAARRLTVPSPASCRIAESAKTKY